MKRVWIQSLLAIAVVAAVCGSTTSAQAQWGYGYYGGPAVVAQPYVAYSAPYAYGGIGYGAVGYGGYGGYGYGGGGYGGYGYGAGPAVVRDRYNYGAFGHLNHHHHAHGYGFGHQHYHTRSPYGW
jgi:hypothetical protein